MAHMEENKNTNKMKYPKQAAVIKRKDKVLGIDAELVNPTEKEDLPPLQMHSGYSRFVLAIVDKAQDIAPTANIPAMDIPLIKTKTAAVISKMIDAPLSETNESITSPPSTAYTQRLTDKNFKGMTPAEILLRDPNNRDRLLKIRQWLASNVAKYPGNKQQIDAIDDALTLFDIGELNKEGISVSNTAARAIEIYRSDYKFKTTQNAKGYNLIYGISVVFESDKKYPYIVNIMNCYAPVDSFGNGQKQIKMNMAEDTIKASMSLSEDEWFKIIQHMDDLKLCFEINSFGALNREANKNSYHGKKNEE